MGGEEIRDRGIEKMVVKIKDIPQDDREERLQEMPERERERVREGKDRGNEKESGIYKHNFKATILYFRVFPQYCEHAQVPIFSIRFQIYRRKMRAVFFSTQEWKDF